MIWMQACKLVKALPNWWALPRSLYSAGKNVSAFIVVISSLYMECTVCTFIVLLWQGGGGGAACWCWRKTIKTIPDIPVNIPVNLLLESLPVMMLPCYLSDPVLPVGRPTYNNSLFTTGELENSLLILFDCYHQHSLSKLLLLLLKHLIYLICPKCFF